MTQDSIAQNNMAELGSAAAGIAHDINNQLTLILNYLETRDIPAARTAAGRCSALTSSLLSWCRGESIHIRSLDPAAFLLDFVDSLHVPDHVRLSFEAEPNRTRIKADPLALTRVLTNLVSNACDAMDHDGEIVIRSIGATIEVSDSGPGIPAAVARRIFDPFYTTKGAQGTGLGLAIVREIMRQHGGHVGLLSEPGEDTKRGATFVLRFRCCQDQV
jgi:signal transduction histidine kinase